VTALELIRQRLAAAPTTEVRECEKSELSEISPPPADLISLFSLITHTPERPERGPERLDGLDDWLARLKRQEAPGDAEAAEANELAEYLAKCDRGEIEIPAHPDEPRLREWNRLAGEKAR
jgi:hypothetical protein